MQILATSTQCSTWRNSRRHISRHRRYRERKNWQGQLRLTIHNPCSLWLIGHVGSSNNRSIRCCSSNLVGNSQAISRWWWRCRTTISRQMWLAIKKSKVLTNSKLTCASRSHTSCRILRNSNSVKRLFSARRAIPWRMRKRPWQTISDRVKPQPLTSDSSSDSQ